MNPIKMRWLVVCFLAALGLMTLSLWAPSPKSSKGPRFLPTGELTPPQDYREWVWLSSGLGMSYGPAAQSASQTNPPFDNVFVTPDAYRAFMQTGKWPNGTMF